MVSIDWSRATQTTIGIVGMKRSGKTFWLSRVALPELANRGIPFICLDMVGGTVEHVLENRCAFVLEIHEQDLPPVIPTQAANVARWVLLVQSLLRVWKAKQGIVLDLGSLMQHQKAHMADAISKLVWKNEAFVHGVVAVDEVHEIVPQDRGTYSPEFERLLRQGGNHDLGFLISTQRPATVNKNLWYLTDVLVVFRQTYEPDVRPILDVMKRQLDNDQTKALIAKIATLQQGEHLVIKWWK